SRSAWAAVKRLANSGVNAGSPAASAGRGGATDAMILIKNGAGSTLSPGHIVGLDGIVNTPETNKRDWAFYRYHKAVKPDPAKYAFAVAIEEIADGKAGYALLTGVCRIKADIKNKEHQFARPVKDKLEHMESCAFGPARLLYREKESGVGEALIQFPMGESWDWGMVMAETASKLDAYAPLGIADAVSAPSGSEADGVNAEFLSRVAVKGETPSKKHRDFVITLADAPGEPGAQVPALYSGICPCLVNIEKKEHTHARAEGSGALKSGFSGFARIVYPTASSRSSGTQWCYVSIPESPPLVFPVALEKTSGDAGDHRNQCSFKYTAYPYPKTSGAEQLGTGIDPNANDSPFRRWKLGKMKEANFGLALYGEGSGGDPKVLLAWCNEIPEVASCEDN
ncbi:MAG: hypothetical protein FWG74_09395, partial [Planctomycetes bacterium]|nr:hypothetical protein [Planctomycetota bacterium]